jgi:hypothetical protein
MGYEKKKKRNRTTGPCCVDNKDWEVEEDLRAIARADAVKADPERTKAVKALAKQKLDESKQKKEEAQHMIDLGTE